MKKILKFKREFILFVIIIAIASFLRLYNLGNVPVGMTDDEIRESYTAYSIAHTGSDAFGNFLPVVFNLDGASTWGPALVYIRAPFSLLLPLDSFTARLPYALSAIFSVIIFYLIVKKLFNNKIALLSSFALSVSVWQVQLARIVIETNISLMLYLLGIFVYLYSKNKTKLIVLSMIIFFLAFYGYSAFKIFFLPLIIILVWYKFRELSKKHLLIILTTVLLTFGSYGFLSITRNATSYTGSNGNFLFVQDKQKTSLSVELERRVSDMPQVIETIYHNKFTYWGRTFATNYLTAFSPQYLFLDQEASGIYSIWGRGEMYIFELPLLLIGALYLFTKKRKEFYFSLLLLLISPLPSALGVGNPTWTSRSAFMIFWLYIFVGAGIYYLFISIKKRKYKYVFLAAIFLIYIYSVLGYVFQYYYDWSRINSKYFATTTKELVYLTNKYGKDGNKVIVSGARPVDFLHFAFYNKIDPKIVQSKINQFPIELNNVTFTKGCFVNPLDDPYRLIPFGTVYISNAVCKYKVKPVSRITTYQNEEVMWNIYLKK